MTDQVVGRSVPRIDLPEKLTGEARYTNDLKLPGMLHGKVLRSPYPHARIVAIETAGAERLAGVHALVTPFDAPEGKVAPDMGILNDEVRFVGDEVAAVAADDEDVAQEAIGLIEVRYDPLPFVTDPEEALRPTAPAVHPGGNLVGGRPLSLERGSIDEGFSEADRIFEDTFTTPAHSGGALEPRAAIASWDAGRLTVWKSSRGVHQDKHMMASALGLESDTVRVIGPHMGAGFGNKDETRLAILAAILAQRAGRPVKIELTREEELIAGRTRHATRTTIRVGVKDEGSITAIHASTIMDTGAYMSSGPGVLRRAGQGALYLYRCPHVRYDGQLVYTNRPSAGSYRALGAPQGHFALEALMDRIAQDLGMDPLDFRLKNHVGPEGQPGQRTTPPDEIIDTQPVEGGVPFSSNGLRECLTRGAEAIGWRERRRPSGESKGPKVTGLGMSMIIYRGGPGGRTAAKARLTAEGGVEVVSGIIDVGEGAATVLAQMAADEMGVSYDSVKMTLADTALTLPAHITAGSMTTFSSGMAVKAASAQLKAVVLDAASGILDAGVDDLALQEGSVVVGSDPQRRITLAELARSAGGKTLEAEASVLPGSTKSIINSFGAHFAEVEVDLGTGQVRIVRFVAAHDSGRIINPALATNQVEGGVSQMLGFTLTEEMITDGRSGFTLNGSYLEHKGPTFMDYPDIQVIFADVVDPEGPFGAKALGEPPSVGVAPAVINAIHNATGLRINDLPVTPDRILNAIQMSETG